MAAAVMIGGQVLAGAHDPAGEIGYSLLDPEAVAVGGGLMASGERVLAALERGLQRAVPFPPALVAARFVHDGALPGAVALALHVAQPARAARPLRAAASGEVS